MKQSRLISRVDRTDSTEKVFMQTEIPEEALENHTSMLKSRIKT